MIRNAKARERDYKLFDERGLFLLVAYTGGKLWRFRYQFEGRPQSLSLGKYPDVSLKQARDRRDEFRRQLADGTNPSTRRKAEREAGRAAQDNTLQKVLEACFPERDAPEPDGRALPKKNAHRSRIELYICPRLGQRPIESVTAEELCDEIRNRLIDRGRLETARRTKMACKKLWAYAMDHKLCTRNVAADLRAIPKPKRRHHPSIREPRRYGDFLAAIESYGRREKVEVATEYAVKILPRVMPRSVELRRGKWCEINFVTAEWRIPPERMKREDPHIIPLSRQALAYLTELRRHTGHQEYLFIGQRTGRPLCENALNRAIKAMGFPDMTAHGVRSFASTMLHEHLWPHAAIEIQLAHLIKNETEAAYNYAQFLPVRRLMMQWYSDFLDSLRLGTPKPALPLAQIRFALAEESFMHDPTATFESQPVLERQVA